MADFSITITNRMALLGGEPPSQWGTMVWGQDKWGDTEDLITATTKVIANSLSFTSSIVLQLVRVIANSFSFQSETTSEQLFDEAGYNYVLRGGVTDAEDRPTTVYVEGSADSTNWSEQSAPSSTWSKA